MRKSDLTSGDEFTRNQLGRSYYCFCLEQALTAIKQARVLVSGDKVETNHELPHIEQLLREALESS